ncbi:hypothetical protein EDC65_4276 [Stella humosa]|uniref:Uncharacterized protein n=2 Tax=Stella humosa TaxID=94 RepID=A0A3N1KWK4_9PROT|nr:hypothetical protein EDC65_4276 [Stella humosa]
MASSAWIDRDRFLEASYSGLMKCGQGYITIELNLADPIEIGDFVGLFAAIGDQYDRFIKSSRPDLAGESKIFIKEIRKGSIITEIFPFIPASLIEFMDEAIIIAMFAQFFGKQIKDFILGKTEPNATKNDLKDYLNVVQAVANDANGHATISTTTFEKGVWRTRADFSFTTKEAREAAATIEKQRLDLDRTSSSDRERQLMVFKRSDRGDAGLGIRSGERVTIEDIDRRDLPLIYASELAEQRIKHEIREADRNIYKLGFVVDVNIQLRAGRPIAYRVTAVHSVIDLPDDESP